MGDHELETAIVVWTVVPQIAGDQRAGVVVANHDHGPLSNQRVVGGEIRATYAGERGGWQVSTQDPDERAARGDLLVPTPSPGGEPCGGLESGEDHRRCSHVQRLVFDEAG